MKDLELLALVKETLSEDSEAYGQSEIDNSLGMSRLAFEHVEDLERHQPSEMDNCYR